MRLGNGVEDVRCRRSAGHALNIFRYRNMSRLPIPVAPGDPGLGRGPEAAEEGHHRAKDGGVPADHGGHDRAVLGRVPLADDESGRCRLDPWSSLELSVERPGFLADRV